MPRFAANLTMMYGEHDFLDRFEAAAHDGFRAVEFLFPYEWSMSEVSARLRGAGLRQILFNLPPGDWSAGERGLAALPGREVEFRASVDLGLRWAEALGCPRLHVMAGVVPVGGDRAAMRSTYVDNLRYAAQRAAPAGVALTIEPLNPRDMPGYFLTHQQQAHEIVAEVGESTLGVQMDFYHCQIVEGDLLTRLRHHHRGVTHTQIAGVPDRQEPDRGEVNYTALLEELDRLGYEGYVGCEYRPRGATSAGLGWLAPWLRG
jgi:hydroxypyruvate isomerase